MREIMNQALSGTLRVMPSKSASHRALLCAALAPQDSLVTPLQSSDDVTATMACLEGMGLAQVRQLEPLPQGPLWHACHLRGLSPSDCGSGPRTAPCGESGSTLRFLMPLALDGGEAVHFTGQGRLMQRPLDVYRRLFDAQGIRWREDASGITLSGTLRGGEFSLPGDVSSQFVTGMMFALPRLPVDSVLRLTGAVESRGYIDLTVAALERCGIRVIWTDPCTLGIPGGQRAHGGTYTVEGDWSHAAFYLVAGLLGGPLRLTGLDADSVQGDRAIVSVLCAMGADIVREGQDWVAHPSALRGMRIDCAQIPDLVPALAVAACAAEGETTLFNAARLRIKESDRLAALHAELSTLGADIRQTQDGLVIRGGRPLLGGTVDSHNDHRIAMALAIAAPLCRGSIHIRGDEAVRKSAPGFWQEYQALGGRSYARTMG